MDEAKSILLDAADFIGWDEEDMLDVVCDFINERGNIEIRELRQYVKEVIEDELSDEFENELEEDEEDDDQEED